MPQTLDDEFAVLATTMPGFGGLYIERDTVVVVVSSDASEADNAAAQFFSTHRGDLRHGATLPRRTVVAQFSFTELYGARETVVSGALPAGVVSVDIDERRNRVVLGTTSVLHLAALRDLSRAGIDQRLFLVEHDNPPQPTALMIDAARPVVAGLGVRFWDFTGTALRECSLSWNVYRRSGGVVDSTVRYFMTASHCGRTFSLGLLESTVFYQGNTNDPVDSIGIEAIDPPTYTGGNCPNGWQCRYSDAQLGRYADSIMWRHGGVAQGNYAPPPAFPVYSYYLMAPIGAVGYGSYRAVGAISGTRGGGSLTKTCYDRAWGPTPYSVWLKCQYQVNLPAYSGDSGGIVYRLDWFSTAVVPLGLRWAGDLLNGGRSDYSPISGLETDLGQLQITSVCATGCFGTYY